MMANRFALVRRALDAPWTRRRLGRTLSGAALLLGLGRAPGLAATPGRSATLGRSATPGRSASRQALDPVGDTFDGPLGLAVGGAGHVYVADSGNHRIQKISGDGEFLASWGKILVGLDSFATPMQIAVSASDRVYVAYLAPGASSSQIHAFDRDGGELGVWEAPGSGDGQFMARGIAAGPDDLVYITESLGSRVQAFDADGGFLFEWGSPGAGEGQLGQPLGVATSPDGGVHVVDGENRRIQHFDADGGFLAGWSTGPDEDLLVSPWFVAVDPDTGEVYVTMAGPAQSVRVFDADGAFLREWGSLGEGNGQFTGLAGVAIDGAGNVLVADSGNNRIQRFTPDGEFIEAWGGVG